MTTDLTWLPLSVRKNIELPRVEFEEWADQPYGGYYQKGILTIVEHESTAAVIAHEFRHYLQDLNGTLGPGRRWSDYAGHSYNKSIRHYFRSQGWEMDALIFQHKTAPTKVSKFWLQALVLPEKFNEYEEM